MSFKGRILGGRYRLLQPLGKGGMGTVWTAEHLELGSRVAIKLIDEELVESTSVRERFRLEAKMAATLNSDHAVRTLDYGVDSGTPYIVMELLDGESLDRRLERSGRLSALELADVLSQVGLALDRAHARGLVHRDLKPANLFLARTDNGRECVKLLDFGTAKSLRHEEQEQVSLSQTRTGALVGSPAYMSPEQLRGVRNLDHSADLWSLGVVAYECLVGQRPFEGRTIADLTIRICAEPLPVPSENAPVPEGFDEWFARACAREPRARFRSARELVLAFEALLPVRLARAAESSLSASACGRTETLLGGVGESAATSTFASAGDETPDRGTFEGAHRESTGALSRTQPARAIATNRQNKLIPIAVILVALVLGAIGIITSQRVGAPAASNAATVASEDAQERSSTSPADSIVVVPVQPAPDSDTDRREQQQTVSAPRSSVGALRTDKIDADASRADRSNAGASRTEAHRTFSPGKHLNDTGASQHRSLGRRPSTAANAAAPPAATTPRADTASSAIPDFGF